MRALARGCLVLAALLAGGCVSYSPVVAPSSSAKPGMAYLTGIFVDLSTQKLPYRSLGISYEHVETGTLHTFEFQKEARDLQVVEVPPGTYHVQGWFMANMMNEVMVRGKPQGALFTRQFKVAPDQVHFLGQYTGSGTVTRSGNMIYYNAQMKPERMVPGATDQTALTAKFPNLGKLPLKAAYF